MFTFFRILKQYKLQIKKILNQLTSKHLEDFFISQVKKCVKCGSCLQLCPIYKISSKEELSPRGKLAILQVLCNPTFKDLLSLDDIEKYLSSCLLCKNCQQTCANDLNLSLLYIIGKILENTKNEEHFFQKCIRILSKLFSISKNLLILFINNFSVFIQNLRYLRFKNKFSLKFTNIIKINSIDAKEVTLVLDLNNYFHNDFKQILYQLEYFVTNNFRTNYFYKFDIGLSLLLYLVFELLLYGNLNLFWYVYSIVINTLKSEEDAIYIFFELKHLYLFQLAFELAKIQHKNVSDFRNNICVKSDLEVDLKLKSKFHLLFDLIYVKSINFIETFICKQKLQNVKFMFLLPYFECYSLFKDSYKNYKYIHEIINKNKNSYISKNFSKICLCVVEIYNKHLSETIINEIKLEFTKHCLSAIITSCYGCYIILKKYFGSNVLYLPNFVLAVYNPAN